MTPEENALLTQVGPGTPCGELLRRYWQPVAYVGELVDEPTKAITVMGEDLVVFRTANGQYGCIEEHCAHRCTSLSYGFVEPDGIRCAYHGWKYDTTGQCVEQPFEPAGSAFRDRIKLKAYPAQMLGGLVFIYMGPTPAPTLPPWDFLVWKNINRKFQRQPDLNCNWLQPAENTADVTHTYFLHGHYAWIQGKHDRQNMRLYRPFVRYGFQPMELGMVKAWEYAPTEQWRGAREVGNMLIFPNILRFAYAMHWRVPQDDTHTHVFAVYCDPTKEPSTREELANPPIEDHPPQYRPDGRHALHTIWSQDRMAWETQGAIVDRSREHLGASDRGIVYLRQTLKEQMERVQQGHDPLGLTRDPELDIIELPLDQYLEGDQPETAPTEFTMSDYLNDQQVWFEVPEGAATNPGRF